MSFRKLKTWYRKEIETETFRTRIDFPNKKRAGKIILAIGIITMALFLIIAIAAPVEDIPYRISEMYQKQEPFRSLMTIFMLSGVVTFIVGVVLWVDSWEYRSNKIESKEK